MPLNDTGQMKYNDPAGGTPSSVGPQHTTHFQIKKALIEARKEQYFTQLADVKNMPKHFGKTMKVFEYIPLLDERNINDQGIDAAGATISKDEWVVTFPATVFPVTNATKVAVAAAINNDVANSVTATAGADDSGGAGFANITLSAFTGATNTGTYLVGPKDTVLGLVATATATQGSGNLYGSSKDIGTITSKLPLLTETGGRVNRVGFTRVEWEGTITKMGFFTEFTQEQMDFDSDSELFMHLTREMVAGAVEISEDLVQKDLLTQAGTVVYAGAATNNGTVTAEGAGAAIVVYQDLQRLSIVLDDNRTPKQTKVITGSRNIDTRTVAGGRVMYIGSELQPMVENMEDQFGNPAFIPIHKYTAASQPLVGEIGSIGHFRIVVVPEMMHWAGEGAEVGTNPGYRETNGRYDIFPMLVVGSESWSTIGFQTDGKTVKFKITTKMPGEATADRTDPYGETGFKSIKWYYGTIVYRPERIALVKAVANL